MQFVDFHHSGLDITGYSEGGIRTSIILPSLSAMFDMGNTNPGQVNHERLFLTHAHLDHFAGLPYYISQRSLRNLSTPDIYLPEEIRSKTDRLLQLYSELEEFPYKYNLVGASPGDRLMINKNYFVKPHRTYHRVISQGYTLYESRTKLKEEYRDLTGIELKKLKNQGITIEDIREVPVFSFSGDTKIEFVLNHEDVQKSKILFLECTYLCDKRDVERARTWGHIHLDEIVAHADSFQNERLVLIHFSQRYRYREIRDWISKKLPQELKEKTEVFIPPKLKSNTTK